MRWISPGGWSICRRTCSIPNPSRPGPSWELLGVEVEILDVAAMEKLGMRALLGVGQGSARPSRAVIMRWNGGKRQPVAFVGKGVCFDSGGHSAQARRGHGGHEGRHGRRGGLAAYARLASRKAKATLPLIGLLENMPDGAAQRPADIVTAMSGTTIEIVNTDAEVLVAVAGGCEELPMVDLVMLRWTTRAGRTRRWFLINANSGEK